MVSKKSVSFLVNLSIQLKMSIINSGDLKKKIWMMLLQSVIGGFNFVISGQVSVRKFYLRFEMQFKVYKRKERESMKRLRVFIHVLVAVNE